MRTASPSGRRRPERAHIARRRRPHCPPPDAQLRGRLHPGRPAHSFRASFTMALAENRPEAERNRRRSVRPAQSIRRWGRPARIARPFRDGKTARPRRHWAENASFSSRARCPPETRARHAIGRRAGRGPSVGSTPRREPGTFPAAGSREPPRLRAHDESARSRRDLITFPASRCRTGVKRPQLRKGLDMYGSRRTRVGGRDAEDAGGRQRNDLSASFRAQEYAAVDPERTSPALGESGAPSRGHRGLPCQPQTASVKPRWGRSPA